MTDTHVRVRSAESRDTASMLTLMRGLAEYEGYAADFAVTEQTLLDQGFTARPPHFNAFVAENAVGAVVGVLVYYFIPFTFRARPTLYIKELFVKDGSRGQGVGGALMRATARVAQDAGCATIKWQVARWNAKGIAFYQALGAKPDDVWVDYWLNRDAIGALAAK